MFEWNEAKSRWNLRERGFSFEYAARIFAGDTIEREDTRRNHGERRIIAYGEVGGPATGSSILTLTCYKDRYQAAEKVGSLAQTGESAALCRPRVHLSLWFGVGPYPPMRAFVSRLYYHVGFSAACYVSGLSMNRAAQLLGVSTPSVMAWLERFAEAYARKPAPEGRAAVMNA